MSTAHEVTARLAASFAKVERATWKVELEMRKLSAVLYDIWRHRHQMNRLRVWMGRPPIPW